MQDRIGVFLSSRCDIDAAYLQATKDVGAWIGGRGLTLCYGGSRSGLMEILATEVKAAGGRCLGVVPQIIRDRQLVSEHLDIEMPCADLSDRKAIMLREADVFVALPGGIGTLDEVFTLLGNITIGLEHRKRMILYNVNGCWDTLVALLADNVARGFAKHNVEQLVTVVSSVAELNEVFEAITR